MKKIFIFNILILVLANFLFADTNELIATDDAYVSYMHGSSNYNNDYLKFGKFGTDYYYIVMKFDGLYSLGITADDVDSAYLELTRSDGSGSIDYIEADDIRSDWNEGSITASWLNTHTSPGSFVAQNIPSWSFEIDLTIAVKRWLNGSNYYGFVMRVVNAQNGDDWEYYDHEHGSSSSDPKLIVYTSGGGGYPDLVVRDSSISQSGPYSPGETIDVDCEIYNIGSGDAGSSELGYYISNSAGQCQVELDDDYVRALSSGASSSESANLTIPSSYSPGTYYIDFKADNDDDVSEENENNNIASIQIVVQNQGSPQINVTPPSLNFGEVQIGSSKTDSVRVENQGTQVLNVTSVNISGSNSNQFTYNGSNSFSLNAGSYRYLNINYHPDGSGSHSANLNISSNDPIHPTVTVPMSGSGGSGSYYQVGSIYITANSFTNVSGSEYIAEGSVKLGVDNGGGIKYLVEFDNNSSIRFNTSSLTIDIGGGTWNNIDVLSPQINNLFLNYLNNSVSYIHINCTNTELEIHGRAHIITGHPAVDYIEGDLTINLTSYSGEGNLGFGNNFLGTLNVVHIYLDFINFIFDLDLGYTGSSLPFGPFEVFIPQTGISASYDGLAHTFELTGGVGTLVSLPFMGTEVQIDYLPVNTEIGFKVYFDSLTPEWKKLEFTRSVELEIQVAPPSVKCGISINPGSYLEFLNIGEYDFSATGDLSLSIGYIPFFLEINLATLTINSMLTSDGFNFESNATMQLGDFFEISHYNFILDVDLNPTIISSIIDINFPLLPTLWFVMNQTQSNQLIIDIENEETFIESDQGFRIFGFECFSGDLKLKFHQDGIYGSFETLVKYLFGALVFDILFEASADFNTGELNGALTAGVNILGFYIEQGASVRAIPVDTMFITFDFNGQPWTLCFTIPTKEGEFSKTGYDSELQRYSSRGDTNIVDLYSIFEPGFRTSSVYGKYWMIDNVTGDSILLTDSTIINPNPEISAWLDVNQTNTKVFKALYNNSYNPSKSNDIEYIAENNGSDSICTMFVIPFDSGSVEHKLFTYSESVMSNTKVKFKEYGDSLLVYTDYTGNGVYDDTNTIAYDTIIEAHSADNLLYITVPITIVQDGNYALINWSTSIPSSYKICAGDYTDSLIDTIAQTTACTNQHDVVFLASYLEDYQYLKIDMIDSTEHQVVSHGPFVNPIVTTVGVEEGNDKVISAYYLRSNQNITNSNCTIMYGSPVGSNIELEVYNVCGQLVKTLESGYKMPGNYSIFWDGSDNNGNIVSSGVYLYRIKIDNFIQTNKLTIVR